MSICHTLPGLQLAAAPICPTNARRTRRAGSAILCKSRIFLFPPSGFLFAVMFPYPDGVRTPETRCSLDEESRRISSDGHFDRPDLRNTPNSAIKSHIPNYTRELNGLRPVKKEHCSNSPEIISTAPNRHTIWNSAGGLPNIHPMEEREMSKGREMILLAWPMAVYLLPRTPPPTRLSFI